MGVMPGISTGRSAMLQCKDDGRTPAMPNRKLAP